MMRIKSHKIAARLKLQPVFPVCQTALEEWKRRTRFKSCRIRLDNYKTRNWLDEVLFKRAIINLLEIAAQKSGQRGEIVFTIISERFSSCCIAIDYALTEKRTGQYEDDMNARPDGETVEIVSQHRGKIEIVEEKQRGRFLIHLPH